MATTPVISAVLATHNGAGTVEDAIASVIDQDFRDWELLVIDDASTDNTAKLVRAIKDPRIKLVELEENVGSGAARNCGFRMSAGEFVAVIDDDDISLPQRFSESVSAFRRYPHVSVVGTHAEEFGSWGSRPFPLAPIGVDGVRRLLRKKKTPVVHPSVMFRRSSLVDGREYDTRCRRAQDYTLLRKFAAEEFHVIDKPLLKYRVEYPVSMSQCWRNVQYHDLAVRIQNEEESGRDSLLTENDVRKFSPAILLMTLKTWFRRNARHWVLQCVDQRGSFRRASRNTVASPHQ